MLKKLLAATILALSTMLVIPALSANAVGWGAPGGNAQWDNTADGSTPIAKRCAGETDRQFAGDLTGQDGLGVNATIGFNIVNSAGQNIDLGGCVAYGYSAIIQLNHYVGYAGQKIGTVQYDAKHVAHGTVGAKWLISHLPSNAARVWIETYTRTYNGSPCGMSCAGTVDTVKYGWTNRRQVPISTYVRLTAPTTTAYHGTDGTVQAKLIGSNGHLADPPMCTSTRTTSCISVHTWSTYTPEGQVVEGWGTGGRYAVGQYRFSSLASGVSTGQPYKIRVDIMDAHGVLSRRIEANTKVYKGYTSNLAIHI